MVTYKSIEISIEDIDEMVKDVFKGKYGNGERRKRELLGMYDYIQDRVNEIDKLAYEVLSGKWDNAGKRKQLLEAAGHNYELVQFRVNMLMKQHKKNRFLFVFKIFKSRGIL